jgi:hypothetical protein
MKTTEIDINTKFWKKFRDSTNIDDILVGLRQLDDLASGRELSLSDAYELRIGAFEALQSLTSNTPDAGEQLILGYLLPYCIEQSADTPQTKVSFAISSYRDCLVDWINQYHEGDRILLRNTILDRLHHGLESERPENVCWTIARIGFRRSDIVEALWKVAERYADKTGDIALYTLAHLGFPPNERLRLLSILHQRAVLRCNIPLIRALSTIAAPESVDVVQKHWLRPSSAEEDEDTELRSLALRVLTDVANATEADIDLQERIWSVIANLCLEYSDVFSSDLFLGSDIVSQCNSERVVPTLMQWLGKETDESESAAHHRYLLCLRLEECVRPGQLRGWEKVDETEALSLLCQDASRDTQYKGRWTTSEMMHKEMAWETLLHLGYADVLAWFEKSVATETNPFLRQKVSEWLACFRLDPLPSTVIRWVTEPYDEQDSDSSGEWASRMGAIQMVRSSASWQAFEALRRFGFTMRGVVLQLSVDALGEVAAALARAGEMSAVDELVETAVDSLEKRHRIAAAGALERIAAAGLLATEHAPRLAAAMIDERRDPFERSLLLTALGHLEIEKVAFDTLPHLWTWARERDDWLGGRSLEILARQGHLPTQPDLLTKRLSLLQVGDRWDLSQEGKLAEWAAFIIGLLYTQNSLTFMPAAASILRLRDWHSAFQLMQLLVDAHRGPERPSLPKEIEEALVERVQKRQTRTSAELETFRVLLYLAPTRLVRQAWEKDWDDWLPQARAALADALGEADYEGAENNAAVSLLLLLARDGQYAVRRSAYRALAHRSAFTLESVCIAWSRESSPLELRQRAAEACSWLPSEKGERFNQLYQELATSSEPTVREAISRARSSRLERFWAEEYLSRVRDAEGKTNTEILSAWRYGQALAQIGDDSCLRVLRMDLENRSLMPNVRCWLRQIIKGMDEHWRKATLKWPDPWLTWEGAIEEITGTLLIDGQSIKVRCSLWQQPASTPSQKHSWGGVLWYTETNDFLQLRSNEFTLQLGDGRQGKGLITRSSGGMTIFVGQRSYPNYESVEFEGES